MQFENEEWLAYILMNMQEIYDGRLSSLIDPNLVCISKALAIGLPFSFSTYVYETHISLNSRPLFDF